jgi:hypothetical protein
MSHSEDFAVECLEPHRIEPRLDRLIAKAERK